MEGDSDLATSPRVSLSGMPISRRPFQGRQLGNQGLLLISIPLSKTVRKDCRAAARGASSCAPGHSSQCFGLCAGSAQHSGVGGCPVALDLLGSLL